jgi:hypothetical protein
MYKGICNIKYIRVLTNQPVPLFNSSRKYLQERPIRNNKPLSDKVYANIEIT